jgi:hypothetical protein
MGSRFLEGMTERKARAKALTQRTQRLRRFATYVGKRRSRFSEGMTERKAKARAKANAGVLRFAQDDGERQTTAMARA